MPTYTKKGQRFRDSIQEKLEDTKKVVLEHFDKCEEKDVVLILDLRIKGINLLWRFDA